MLRSGPTTSLCSYFQSQLCQSLADIFFATHTQYCLAFSQVTRVELLVSNLYDTEQLKPLI